MTPQSRPRKSGAPGSSAGHGGGRILERSIEDVLQRADLVDLVSGYTQLVKRGAEHTGRCPFHDERTPSFWVNQPKGVYHCFGCGASGDTIRFAQEKLGLDFVEAVEYLADRYRVELQYDAPAAGARRTQRVDKRRLYAVLEAAASFFVRYLADAPEADAARTYVQTRGIDAETAAAFGLGFSPSEATGTARRARARGFSEVELRRAGLLTSRGNDFFRGRLMVPIRDRAERTIGFGARKLVAEQFGGKYVNSPDTPVFHKKAVLFIPPGLREAARDAGNVVVVEGYMDVIALWQAGIRNCVAAMGTSLTDAQIVELARISERVLVAFDADAAGQAATLRALERARGHNLDVRVVELVDGDPADIVGLPDGVQKMQTLLATSVPLLAYQVTALLKSADLATGPGRSDAFTRAKRLFAEAAPSPERSEQATRVADRLQLDSQLSAELIRVAPQATAGVVSGTAHREGTQTPRPAAPRGRPGGLSRVERTFLAAALTLAELGELAGAATKIDSEHFAFELHARAWRAIRSGSDHPLDISAIREDREVVELFAELTAARTRDRLDSRDAARAVVDELELRLERQRLERAIVELKEALSGTDEDRDVLAKLAELETQRRMVDPRLRNGAPNEE